MPISVVLYHLALSCWLGGAALFTFVLTPKLFSVYSRDQAGAIVGFLFPGYFRWGLVCGVVALVCLLINRGRFAAVSLAVLLFMLALTGTQAYVLEPRAAAVKQHIASFTTTPKNDPHRLRFRRLHALSMAANLAVIGGGVLLIVLAALPGPALTRSADHPVTTPPGATTLSR
ncbi:MAG: DUF4149 domain-containing protein [Desulfobulbus sp.]